MRREPGPSVEEELSGRLEDKRLSEEEMRKILIVTGSFVIISL